MKKILCAFLMLCCLSHPKNIQAETLNAEHLAEKIYSDCEKQLSEVHNTHVLSGNKSDVTQARKLRQCLKSEIIKIANSFISSSEIELLKQQLEKLETASSEIYRILIFCSKNEDKAWCTQFYKEDASLGKLLLEQNINAQLMNILINTIDAKQGGFRF